MKNLLIRPAKAGRPPLQRKEYKMKPENTKYNYFKVNDEPIPIEYVPDEHEAENDFKASFWFYNKRYFLENFIRAHNNPWITDNFPEHIHGMEAENYFHPVFIELISDEYVNVYEYKPEDEP